jgi:hypothetical protein
MLHGKYPTFFEAINHDEVVKSRKMVLGVIPANAGIQYYQSVLDSADASLRAWHSPE